MKNIITTICTLSTSTMAFLSLAHATGPEHYSYHEGMPIEPTVVAADAPNTVAAPMKKCTRGLKKDWNFFMGVVLGAGVGDTRLTSDGIVFANQNNVETFRTRDQNIYGLAGSVAILALSSKETLIVYVCTQAPMIHGFYSQILIISI